MTLNDLAERVKQFEACDSLKPVIMNFEMTLLMISATLASLSKPDKECNNYLKFKKIKEGILEIQKNTEDNKAQAAIIKLLHSPEFSSLTDQTTFDFLNSQLQELLPHNLVNAIQTVLEEKHPVNREINNILANGSLTGEEKTKKIEKTISNYTDNTSVVLFDPDKPLKSALTKVLYSYSELIQTTYTPSSPTKAF